MNIVSQKQHKINSSLQNKRAVWLLQPLFNLSLSARMVFSYRAYQQDFDVIPNSKTVAKAIGLDQRTVITADRELRRLGLLTKSDEPIEPMDNMFRPRKNGSGGHWRHRFAYWPCFIRAKGCKLSVATIALWSFLYHVQHSPNFGPDYWSMVWIADQLRFRRQTVVELMAALRKAGSIYYCRRQHGIELAVKPPGPDELARLADKATYRHGTAETGTLFPLDKWLREIAPPTISISEAASQIRDAITTEGDLWKLAAYIDAFPCEQRWAKLCEWWKN